MAIRKASTRLPAWIADGVAQDTTITVDGGDSAAASVTYTLQDPDGTAQVDAQAGTVSSGVLTYSLSSAEANQTKGDRWLELWTVTDGNGDTFTVVRPAAIVTYPMLCPVVPADILELHPEWSDYPSGESDWEKPVAKAWHWTARRMIASSYKPYLTLSPDAFHFPCLFWATSNVARMLSTYVGPRERYAELAAEYWQRGNDAWDSTVTLIYDRDDDGIPDAAEQQQRGGRWTFGVTP